VREEQGYLFSNKAIFFWLSQLLTVSVDLDEQTTF